MATLWDDSMKLLIGENAQDFVSWIMKGAEYKAKLATEFKGQELRADILLQVEVIGLSGEKEDILLQIEIQSERDPDMRERLLAYNLRARKEHKMEVYSCVIYLRDDGIVLPSPLRWELPIGKKYLDLDFDSIEIYKMSAAELQQMGLPGLLPLMILTKDGATREVADTIFTELEAAGRLDSLSPTYVLVSLAFGKDNIANQRWLLRRLEHMQEQLNESPVYQEMTRMAREAGFELGLEQGLAKGLQQGQIQALRQMVIDIVIEQFPQLVRLAEEKTTNVSEPFLLRKAALKLSKVATAEEARQTLINLNVGH
jgi:predicted transposase YdaD